MSELQNFKTTFNKDWLYSFDEIRFGGHIILKVEDKEFFFSEETEKFLFERKVK